MIYFCADLLLGMSISRSVKGASPSERASTFFCPFDPGQGSHSPQARSDRHRIR